MGHRPGIRPLAPADLRISSLGPVVWDFPGQGGGYHRDAHFQFYSISGGAYVPSNQIRERFTLGAPGSIGNTCNVPSVATNPNPVLLNLGAYTDRYGVSEGGSEGFLRLVCQANPGCHTFTTQHVKVETSDGQQIGDEWTNTIRFYCTTVDVSRP
jgi:hypothetical protein